MAKLKLNTLYINQAAFSIILIQMKTSATNLYRIKDYTCTFSSKFVRIIVYAETRGRSIISLHIYNGKFIMEKSIDREHDSS